MAKPSKAIERELAEFVAVEGPALCKALSRRFPSLRDEVEDLFQTAVEQTLQKVRAKAFRPRAGWAAWLRRVAEHRALERLRSWERRTFVRLAASSTSPASDASSTSAAAAPVDPNRGPQREVLEDERRGRQGVLLSEILKQFARYCEASARRLPMKEAYERGLRGQRPAEIAAALGVDRNQVDLWLKRARDWVLERVRQEDVDRSVFLTLHRVKPE
ncbi:MAG: hypothetical protein K6T86_01905 [Pirellulales bacterium]|nr:hypothetical protein [Pirellulales bacterium]